ncbi:hypothetical protein [Phytohabitans rumicis]|uniref:Type VII secretion-associated protein n=1 Tax=Phytohabitans rumicis TaxID=1076125 RepID=A0A6V8KY86_9ACTN|nr:hypothetical protein [Phytohabitans rumicis]GFJ90073.1 hypothetical protein Prum_037150 [Phytohabitans rumicis]
MPLFRIAAAAIAGVLTAGPAPAVAVEPCTNPIGYAAGAGAELVRLALLDLHPLGVPVGPVADVRIGSTRSAVVPGSWAGVVWTEERSDEGSDEGRRRLQGPGARASGASAGQQSPINAAAAARYLDAKVLGVPLPAGPLSASVYQAAPPRNTKPVTARAVHKHLGVASVGTGDLSAHATCGATRTSAALADASVLPGPAGTALVRLPENLRTHTATNGPEATASAGLTEVRILAGTPGEITVKVLRSATLTVARKVTYSAPILQVWRPGIGKRRLDTPGQTVDVPLGGLADLLGVLEPERLRGATATAEAGPLALPGLPLPAGPLTGALPKVGGAGSLVRLTVGEVDTTVRDDEVRAEATTLRVQVVTRPTDGDGEQAVVDLAIGMLDAMVLAPRPIDRPNAPQPPAGDPGGLPVTGANVLLAAGVGGLLLILGGLFVWATRSIHDRPYG